MATKTDDMRGGAAEEDFFDPFAIRETEEDKGLTYDSYDAGRSGVAGSVRPPPAMPAAAKSSGSWGLGGLFGRGGPAAPSRTGAGGTHTTVDDGTAPSEADAAPITTSAPLDLGAAALAGNLAVASYAKTRGGLNERERQFLQVERRGLWGQSAYNIGYSYFGGLMLGGVYGLIYGLRTSPNRHPRILVNSVLNGSGKYGAKVGNAAGVLALVYTLVERQMEDVGLDTLPRTLRYHTGIDVGRWLGSDAALPALSAFATGMLFTLPRAITMKGLDKHYVSPLKRLGVMVSGGVLTTVGVAALSVVGPLVFGHRSPYRFSANLV